jgi:hypothetical protein
MAIPFLPISEGEFAGYRIDSATGAKIEFKLDEKGAVKGLMLPAKKDFIALREKQ